MRNGAGIFVTWETIVALGGAIILLNSVAVVAMNWVKKVTDPKRKLDERITKLEEYIRNDDLRIKELENVLVDLREGDRVISRALLSLLKNETSNGNCTEDVKKQEAALTEYLIDKS